MIPHVVVAIDLYSASVENLETMYCFLDLQDTRAFPKKYTITYEGLSSIKASCPICIAKCLKLQI